VKTDRFSTRAAVVLLAGLLLADGLPAAGRTIQLGRLKMKFSVDSPTRQLAQALAPEVEKVKNSFDTNRRALRTVPGSDGKPAYLRPEVAGLIARTGEDLDKAIEKVQPSALEPLRAWSADALGRIQGELAPPPGPRTAALPSGLFTPRAVAVVASLRGFPLLALAKPKATKPKSAKPKAAAPPQAAPPPQDTVTAEKTDSLLNQVGELVGRILFLANHDDLEVKLWVGSTAPHATFSFWPQGRIKGSAPAPTIIRTDGKRDHVVRGLYVYRAAWTKGAVTELIEFPKPAGTSVAMSERLDLVNGSGFFCCRFNEQYCHNVANEKECRR
jgi:hypothetical protein